MSEKTPLVSVCTMAYNQAPYIRECLDGILMQKTDFTFELLIHDDASTDGTADIIREYEAKYPDIVKPIYQTENQYSKKINICQAYIYPRVKGEYIAFCEGDDYWTDPLKLQTQVDFLERNSDVSCCFHMVDIFQQNTGKYEKSFMPKFLENTNENSGEYFTNLERNEGWFAYILSIVYRAEYRSYLEEERKRYKGPFNDNHIIYYLLKNSKSYIFKKSMAIYRKNDGGIFGNKSQEYKLFCTYNISKELYLNEPDAYTKYQYICRIREILKAYINNREYIKAFKWKRAHGRDLKKSYLYICSKIIVNLFKAKR